VQDRIAKNSQGERENCHVDART